MINFIATVVRRRNLWRKSVIKEKWGAEEGNLKLLDIQEVRNLRNSCRVWHVRGSLDGKKYLTLKL